VGYAIIRAAGSQFRVSQGQIVRIPSVAKQIGSSIEFEVLARGDGDRVEIGSPLVDGAHVSGTILEHGRDKKIIVFKYKRRKQYKKTHGHRQNFTAVRIDSIGIEAEGDKADNSEAQSLKADSGAESASVETEQEATAGGAESEQGEPEDE
jgi:large subunit ribosomal protein L21